MRVLVQWATDQPGAWASVDASAWPTTPTKPDPTGTAAAVDSAPGWVSCLNVQGVWVDGFDHYAVQRQGVATVVTAWRDDPAWVDEPHAYVITFNRLRRDPRHGGAWNTDQRRVVYAVPGGRVAKAWANVEACTVKPWADFVPPPAGVTRHGKNTTDELHQAHVARRGKAIGTHWRDWTEGIPRDELVGGRVPSQRRIGRWNVPPGTKTYYCRDTAEATAAYNADNENDATTGTATAANQSASIKKNAEELAFTFATPSGEPNSSDWPNGTYDCQLDSVTGTGADITFGMLTIGSADGEFARLESTLATRQEGTTQSQGAFSGTGLKLGSQTWNPTSGNSADRFMVVVAAGNAHTKDAQSLTLELNESDDYTSGPWSAGSQTISAVAATVTVSSQTPDVSAGSVSVDTTPASVTCSAQTPDVGVGQVTVTAGAATCTVAGQSADCSIVTNVAAQPATCTVAAQTPDVSPGQVTVGAGVASCTVAAQSADVSPGQVTCSAAVASVTCAAQSADVSPGQVSVAASAATCTVAAQSADCTIATTVAASAATITASAQTADVSVGQVSASAAAATCTAAAQSADVSPGQVSASASPASCTVSSQSADVSVGQVGVDAQAASVTCSAQAATVGVGQVSCAAQVASCTVAAQSADVSPGQVTIAASPATLTVASQSADVDTGGLSVDAVAATVTATAPTADVAVGQVSVVASPAFVTCGAQSADVSPGQVTVSATPATCTASALSAGAVLSGVAQVAASPAFVTVSAPAPVVDLRFVLGLTLSASPALLRLIPAASPASLSSTANASPATLALSLEADENG